MTALFTKVLDMSLTASVVIGVVLAARYLLRNGPKVISYALWAVVLFRLLCPVSVTAEVAVLEVTKPTVTVTSGRTSSISYLPERQNELTPEEPEAPVLVAPSKEPVKQLPKWDWMTAAAWIWVLGMAGMMLHCLASYLRLCRQLIGAVPAGKGIYLADRIPTPFVLGILKPKIYIPSDTPEKEIPYILAHEKHHIRRMDPAVKLLAYGALCLHWFNPLVWLAFFLAGKDMEMSCDEAVIRQFGPEVRADYVQSLLRLAAPRSVLAGIPLAFGEGDTKGRVKHMAKWKKPKTWVVTVSILLCIGVLAACAVNPGKQEEVVQSETAKPTEPAMADEAPVTMGLKLPLDVMDVEYGERERRFFPVEDISGQASTQIIPTELLGGIRIYDAPEIGLEDMKAWLHAVGVPQVVDGGYDYMASGSMDADLEVSFIDAGGRETKHYYYRQGALVFELWFDPSRLDNMTQAAIRESVRFAPDAIIERSLPFIQQSDAYDQLVEDAERMEERINLVRCRDALTELQSRESISISSRTNNFGGPILNDTSSYEYHKHGEDWVKLSQIPDEGFTLGYARFGYLCVDGKYYDNADTFWDEEGNIHWAESEFDPLALPWIARFDWDAQDVVYVSTVPAGKGMAITLQVMAPYYPEDPEVYDFYQMQFIFNEHTNLERIENTVFFRSEQDGDYSSREFIQVKADWAKTVIDATYKQYLDQN